MYEITIYYSKYYPGEITKVLIGEYFELLHIYSNDAHALGYELLKDGQLVQAGS